MSWYLTIKWLHVASAMISISGFTLRGGLLYAGIDYRRHRATHVLPHVIDTFLLGSAIYLAVASRQYPISEPWLTAKLAGLMFYIVLGTWALKWARSGAERAIALAAALLCFGYIIAVALTRSPTPW